MGQVGERLWVLLHEPEGPLVAYLDAFASHLDAQGFKRHLLGRQIRQAAKFSRWLQSARVAASAVTEEHDTHEHMGRIVPKRDIGQFHSITASAVASNTGGTEMPSALAVLRLITRSNLSGR